MKSIAQILAVIAICGLAQDSFARTRVVENPGTRTVTPRVQTVPQVKGSAVTNGAVVLGQESAGESCSREEVINGLTAGGSISAADAAEAVDTKSLVIQSCKAGARGLLNMGAQAKRVAVETVLAAKRAGQQVSARFLAMAKSTVLGINTTAAAEETNFQKLSQGECQVFAQ